MHQSRDEIVGLGVFVVLYALDQRAGAVANADDRDTHFFLTHPTSPFCIIRSFTHRNGCVCCVYSYYTPYSGYLSRNAERKARSFSIKISMRSTLSQGVSRQKGSRAPQAISREG